MDQHTQQTLLELNRRFYATVATEFDRTRAGFPSGWQALFRRLPSAPADRPRRVLDVGCGNGRFARALAAQGAPFDYMGVDEDATLLALANEQTADLAQAELRFVRADLSAPDWVNRLPAGSAPFDLIACLAALHHLPGYDLRVAVMRTLRRLLAQAGVLAVSNWQFLNSERFAQKQVDWATVGLDAGATEAGDALLPWNQGVHALRFVHHIDEAEMTRLAGDAGLKIMNSFYADGKEGNLNLYSLMRMAASNGELEIGDKNSYG